MIKLYLFSLLSIVLALLVSLNLGFPGDPGYLLIAFGSTTFETSLFALLVAFIVLYVVIKLILIVFAGLIPGNLFALGEITKKTCGQIVEARRLRVCCISLEEAGNQATTCLRKA